MQALPPPQGPAQKLPPIREPVEPPRVGHTPSPGNCCSQSRLLASKRKGGPPRASTMALA